MIKKIFLYVLMLCIGARVVAMDGNLDTTFGGGDGFLQAPAGVGGIAVAIQTNGEMVGIGPDASDANLVVRYDVTGTTATILATDPDYFGVDVLIQPDGKILVVGIHNLNSTVILVRYNSDGSLDTTFGTGGKVDGPMGIARAVILQPDGKIVITGTDFVGNFLTIRYNNDGTLDTIFQSVPLGLATDIAIQADGKIIVGGQPDSVVFTLVRYNTNGTVDLTYGVGGVATGPLGALMGIVIQDDGKVVAGGFDELFPTNFVVARFTTAGFLDTSYGMAASGFFVGPQSQGLDVVLQGDGQAVLLGHLNSTDWRLVRYTTAGLIDGSFNINAGPLGIFARGGAIAGPVIPADNGKIVGIGVFDTNVWQIARYLSTPGLVATTITSPTNGSTFPAGTIVLSGTAQNPSSVYIFVDGVWVQTAGVATGPGSSDTWTTTVTIATGGAHTIQAISIYEDGNVDIASEIINITVEANEPPTNFRGVVSCNAFLNVKECILTMTWTASPSPNIAAYRILRNDTLIGTVSATSPLRFTICATSSRCISCCSNPVFQNITIVAVTSDGMQSDPVALELVC